MVIIGLKELRFNIILINYDNIPSITNGNKDNLKIQKYT